MIVPTKSFAESKRCLRCKEIVSGQEHGCSACGYSLEGTKLYNPTHFVLLALFFTGMVPIFLAASNWGRLGDLSRKRRWLWLGLAGYMIVFSAAILLPDLGRFSNKFIGYLINLPVGMALLGMQRSTYLSALTGRETRFELRGTPQRPPAGRSGVHDSPAELHGAHDDHGEPGPGAPE